MAWIHPPALGCRFSFLHLPCGRCGHTAVVHSTSLYIFGGFEGKKWLNDLHKFDTCSFVWSQPRILGSAPQPRQYHTSVCVKDSMYIFGGYNGTGWLKDLIVLDLKSFKWQYPKTFGDIPTGREGHTMNYYQDYLYIFGGWDGMTIGNLYRININNFVWEKIEILGEKPMLCGHSANLLNGNIFVFGGFEGNNWVNSMFRINLASFWCEKINTKGEPMARGYHSATLVNRYLLVYAGYNGKFILGDLVALDTENLVWSLPDPCIGHFPSARNAHTISILGSELFLFGGYNGTRDTNDLHILETAAFSTLQDDLRYSIGFNQGKIFALACSDESLMIHTAILNSRCPKLIEKPDLKMSLQAAKVLIEYLYCDISSEKIPDYMRPELSRISINLGLNRLRKLCDEDSEIPETTLTEDIVKILTQSEDSDFTVLVGNKEFLLHKVILSARCPYFRSMFECGMSENSKNKIEFQDFRLSAFEFIVEWIYSDKFSPLFGDTRVETQDFIHILLQSNMLGLESLMRMTELAAESVLNTSNVVELFEVSHYLGAIRLKSYTLNFILREFETVPIKRELLNVSDNASEVLNQYLPRRIKKQSSKNGIFPSLSLVKLDKKLTIKPHDPSSSRLPSRELNGIFSFRNPVNNLVSTKHQRTSSPVIRKSVVRRQHRANTFQCQGVKEPIELMIQGVSPRANRSDEKSPVLRVAGMQISSSLGALYQHTLNELSGSRFLLYK